MTVPSSGELSLGKIRQELESSDYSAGPFTANQTSITSAETGSYVTINTSSPSYPDGIAPYSMTEWYGYDQSTVSTPTPTPTSTGVATTPTPTPTPTPSVGSGIVTSGLILRYDFAETSSYPGTGTAVTDLSNSGNDGTLLNGPTFTSTSPKYLTFDGLNDNISAQNTLTSTDWTIDMWIKKTSNQNAGFDRLWAMSSFRFEIALDTSNNVRYYDGVWRYTSININTNWNNLVLTFKNNSGGATRDFDIYLNNSLVRSATNGRTFVSSALNIGAKSNGGEAATFDLNEVKVYNRQLTSDEVNQNYNARVGRF